LHLNTAQAAENLMSGSSWVFANIFNHLQYLRLDVLLEALHLRQCS
jgi:hypothetical protein